VADKRKRLGQFGEDVAANYLQRQGHTIVARGWRCRYGELDLITRDGAELVFVEVRTRRASDFGSAEESVGAIKQARLVRLAYEYLAETSATEQPWRIDVLAVTIDATGKVTAITHIPSAIGEGG
jgi:putative endonuclease